jgi:hypothetical protein
MISTDIGLAVLVLPSLGTELTGAGFTYADFTWQATNTYGAINKGQFFGTILLLL